uniref:TIR domain-containing protein n=1 Tax=viral metagenome TaxID=1070528 RepID=A0A6M3J5N8_9ZZZZ
MFNIDASEKDFVDKEGISKSDVFIVVFSEFFEKDPLRLEELEFAIQQKKKIAVMVIDDADPEPYLKKANVIMKRYFNRGSKEKLQQELMADFVAELTELLQKTENP